MAEVKLTAANFEEEVINSNLPVLVDFWATWCPPCRMLAPIVADIAAEYAGRIKVGKVNVDEEQLLAAKFKIDSIPALMVFKNGRLVNSTVGYCTKDKVLALLQ